MEALSVAVEQVHRVILDCLWFSTPTNGMDFCIVPLFELPWVAVVIQNNWCDTAAISRLISKSFFCSMCIILSFWLYICCLCVQSFLCDFVCIFCLCVQSYDEVINGIGGFLKVQFKMTACFVLKSYETMNLRKPSSSSSWHGGC